MIADLKPYPEYKLSGTTWLGDVPAHWEVQRNGRLFAQRIETGFPDLPILEVSLKTGVRVRDFVNSNRKQVIAEKEKYKRAQQGDIAYNMMRMWQGAVGVAPVDGLVSPAYVVARPLPGTEPIYFQHLFCTPAYKDVVNTFSRGIVSDRNRLYWEDFKQIPSPVPSPDEQAAIVRFLSYANARIERAVRAKRKLIALLNEQKHGIILHAITRGFNPAARLKPSGVPWLGDVPEQWGVKRLKWVTRLQRGYDLPADRRRDGEYPVVSSGGVIDSHNETRAKGPGVVMGRYGSTGAVFYIEQAFWPHNTALFVTDFNGNFPKWCFYLLSTISKADHSSKSAVPGIDRKDLYDIYVAQPPKDEQAKLVEGIERESAVLSVTIARAEREIALLREYRTTLTADVVTGKLDVREAVKNLPTSAEQPTAPDGADVPDDTDDELTEFAE
jgi:type I restriction enzyme, S subunit